ncbi:hypothetical protein U1Q18_025721 [Sarracenia purpurea var. burkii]
MEWANLCLNAVVELMACTTSDHLPICVDNKGKLDLQTRRHKPKIYRFEQMWLRASECEDVIARAWNSDNQRSSGRGTLQRIADTSQALIRWNKTSFGNVQRNIKNKMERIKSLRSRRPSEDSLSEEGRDLGIQKIHVEGDSLTVINAVNSEGVDRSLIGSITEAIKAELALFSSTICTHIRRNGNSVAHGLARLATSGIEPRKWMGDIHPPLRHLVEAEAPREMMVSEDLWDIGQHSWYLLIVSGQHASHSFTEEPLPCHAWLIECLVDSPFRHGRAYVGWRFWCVSILKQGRDQALFEPSTGKDGACVGWRFWCVSILKQGRDQALFEPSTGKDGTEHE